jgi:hypothetical protein
VQANLGSDLSPSAAFMPLCVGYWLHSPGRPLLCCESSPEESQETWNDLLAAIKETWRITGTPCPPSANALVPPSLKDCNLLCNLHDISFLHSSVDARHYLWVTTIRGNEVETARQTERFAVTNDSRSTDLACLLARSLSPCLLRACPIDCLRL